MKINALKNDKSTWKDELVLFLLTLIPAIGGILLLVFRPSFFIISSTSSTVFGVLLLVLAFMYFPCLLWRLMNNDKKG